MEYDDRREYTFNALSQSSIPGSSGSAGKSQQACTQRFSPGSMTPWKDVSISLKNSLEPLSKTLQKKISLSNGL